MYNNNKPNISNVYLLKGEKVMARISYEDYEKVAEHESDYSVGFFSLKHDGDEAIVRILCDSLADLDILTIHPIKVGDSSFNNREVSCLRESLNDPIDKCPLCARGEKVKNRVYIKMLQYDPETRQLKAVVWNRLAKDYVPKLKSYIANYGPLSQIVCKIVRHGSGLDTTYDIVPNLNPNQYTLEAYPLDVSDFEDFKVLGRMVYDKDASEIMTFIQTGQFPQKKSNGEQYGQPQAIPGGYNQIQGTPNPNVSTYTPQQPVEFPQDYAVPPMQGAPSMNQSPLDSAPSVDPWGNPINNQPPQNQGMGRPQRL